MTEFFEAESNNKFRRNEIITELSEKYKITPGETKVLTHMIFPDKFSLKEIIGTVKELSDKYQLTKDKSNLTKASAYYFASAGLFALGGLFRGHSLTLPISNHIFDAHISVRERGDKARIELMKTVQKNLSERMANALMYCEYNEMDADRFAEIHTKLQRGKSATERLFNNLLADIGPRSAIVASSSLSLFMLHPLVGAINLYGVKGILKQSDDISKKMLENTEKQREAEEHSTSEILSVIKGGEEVILAPNKEGIHKDLEDGLKSQDKYAAELETCGTNLSNKLNHLFWGSMKKSSYAAALLWLNQNTVENIPFVGEVDLCALPSMPFVGDMTTEAVIAASSVTAALNSPFIGLLQNFHGQLKTDLMQIYEMEELLSSGTLDLPDGDAEKERISVTALENHRIEIKQLQFKDILEDVSLVIEPGEFVTVTGLSGSGKTTLLRNLLGLNTPNKGEVTIGSTRRQDIKKHNKTGLNNTVSYCGQSPIYHPSKTLKQNLLYGSFEEGITTKKMEKILKELGLEKFCGQLDDKLSNPSGGERLRIGLARALLRDGNIIVLDEPTAALDDKTTDSVVELLKDIHTKYPNKTIISVTHSRIIKEGSDRNFDLSEYQEEKAKYQSSQPAQILPLS